MVHSLGLKVHYHFPRLSRPTYSADFLGHYSKVIFRLISLTFLRVTSYLFAQDVFLPFRACPPVPLSGTGKGPFQGLFFLGGSKILRSNQRAKLPFWDFPISGSPQIFSPRELFLHLAFLKSPISFLSGPKHHYLLASFHQRGQRLLGSPKEGFQGCGAIKFPGGSPSGNRNISFFRHLLIFPQSFSLRNWVSDLTSP